MLCRCCRRRRGRLNECGLCRDCEVCLHCERRPAVGELGLCDRCLARPCIVTLYRRGANWSPEWEMHLRRKTAEVQGNIRKRNTNTDVTDATDEDGSEENGFN
jgi:hypothetical protein